MTLKEILAERKRQALASEKTTDHTIKQVAVSEQSGTFEQPHSEFYALFEGCTDF